MAYMVTNALWDELEGWLAACRPEAYDDLAPPASEQELERFAARFSISPPDDLLASLARHNGEQFGSEFIFGRMRWLLPIDVALEQAESCERSARRRGTFEKRADIEPFGPVKAYDWSSCWTPFFLDNDVLYCIDMEPAPGGTPGQVIIVDHEDLSLTRVASSFTSFLGMAFAAARTGAAWPFKGRQSAAQ
jgi:molybdopterin molybdotransferase